MLRSWLPAAAVALVTAAGAGCTRRNADFCCTAVEACERHGGDSELVRCPEDSDRPYCDNQQRTCIEPPGQPCGPAGECDDPETPICFEGLCVQCAGADDCPFSQPVCGAGDHQCGSCDDAAECEGFADRPFCDQGACVGCRDGGDCQEASPICDAAAGVCRGCTSADECPSAVCDWVGGGCVAEADVLYVATDGTGSQCTRDDPCDSIMQAVGQSTIDRNWILMAPDDYQETVDLDGRVIRIVGDGASLRGDIDSPVISVRGGADLMVTGLRIHSADGNGDGPGDGVYCTNAGGSATVLLDRVVIEGNDDQGVDANNCTLILARSILRDNRRGGLALDSVDFDVTNNLIVGNGTAAVVNAGGVLVGMNPPTAGRLEFNTITLNSNMDMPAGIQCVLVGNTLTFRNNIIYDNVGSDTQVDSDNCVHRYSVIGPEPASGTMNISNAPTFLDDTTFHLAPGSSGIDAAESSTVDFDIDGDSRPAGPASDIGADEAPVP